MNEEGVNGLSIATTVASIFTLFRAWNDKVTGRNEVGTEPWKDQLGRFKLWCSNLGAHQKATSSSLDARLRDAPHMREQILRILHAIEADLEDLVDVGEESLENEAISPTEDADVLAEEETEILVSVNKAIDALFQAAMYVRQSTNRPSILQIRYEDSHHFQAYYALHVKEKFPLAVEEIVTRLAAVMARRRSLLRYYEDHSKKLTEGVDQVAAGANEDPEAQTTLSPTLATNYIDTVPDTVSSNVPTADDPEGSVYSGSLFQSSDRLTIPPRPPESREGRPFECPVCHRLEVIHNDQTWARHLFQDIQPYCCILHSCVMPTAWYGSRRQWLAHIQQDHAATLAAEQPQCVLCQESASDMTSLSKHVCRHLEDLALFALPGHHDESDVNADDPVDDESLDESTDDSEAEFKSPALCFEPLRLTDLIPWQVERVQFYNYYVIEQMTLKETAEAMAKDENIVYTKETWMSKARDWGVLRNKERWEDRPLQETGESESESEEDLPAGSSIEHPSSTSHKSRNKSQRDPRSTSSPADWDGQSNIKQLFQPPMTMESQIKVHNISQINPSPPSFARSWDGQGSGKEHFQPTESHSQDRVSPSETSGAFKLGDGRTPKMGDGRTPQMGDGRTIKMGDGRTPVMGDGKTYTMGTKVGSPSVTKQSERRDPRDQHQDGEDDAARQDEGEERNRIQGDDRIYKTDDAGLRLYDDEDHINDEYRDSAVIKDFKEALEKLEKKRSNRTADESPAPRHPPTEPRSSVDQYTAGMERRSPKADSSKPEQLQPRNRQELGTLSDEHSATQPLSSVNRYIAEVELGSWEAESSKPGQLLPDIPEELDNLSDEESEWARNHPPASVLAVDADTGAIPEPRQKLSKEDASN